jgi:hypothetical protein
MYPLRYIEDFFPSRKLEEQLKIRFRSREGFHRPSLDLLSQQGGVLPRLLSFGATPAFSLHGYQRKELTIAE